MEKISRLKENWLKKEIADLKNKGISKADIAIRLGVKPQYLNNITNGGRGITDAFLDKFIEEFGINHIDLLDNQRQETSVIYKSDPKDIAALSDKQMIIDRDAELISALRDKIRGLEAQLSTRPTGLYTAHSVGTTQEVEKPHK